MHFQAKNVQLSLQLLLIDTSAKKHYRKILEFIQLPQIKSEQI